MLRYVLLLALLPFSLARPLLLGYSSASHFACAGTSCPPQPSTSSLSALLNRLSASASHPAPSLTLVVHAGTSSARALLPALARAVGGSSPTSVVAPSDAFAHPQNPLSVDEVAALKLTDKPAVLHVELADGQKDQLLRSIRSLAGRDGKTLAVIWAAREDADAAPAADAGAAPADAAADPAAADPAPADPPAADPVVAEPDAKDANVMNPPEINSAGFAGLLVALIFLLIFIPGFLCLSKITPPQTFEIMDSNDMKKKLQ